MSELSRGETNIFIGGKNRKIILRSAAIRHFERKQKRSILASLGDQDAIGIDLCAVLLECGLLHYNDRSINEESINAWIDALPPEGEATEDQDTFASMTKKLIDAIISGMPGASKKQMTPTLTTTTTES